MIEELVQYALQNPESSGFRVFLMIAVLWQPIKWFAAVFTTQQSATNKLIEGDAIQNETAQILATALSELATPIRDNANATQQILLYMKRQDNRLAKIDKTTLNTNSMMEKASGAVKDVGVLKLLLQLLAHKQGIDIKPILSSKDKRIFSEYRKLLMKEK